MEFERWHPTTTLTPQEQFLMRRLRRTRKLFGFLRTHRDELFSDDFQGELESMCRDSGAGKPPVAPALMAMAVLVQGYVGASDAEAVELSVVDLRWQLVLDCLGATAPAFSQGALHDFRHRLIRGTPPPARRARPPLTRAQLPITWPDQGRPSAHPIAPDDSCGPTSVRQAPARVPSPAP